MGSRDGTYIEAGGVRTYYERHGRGEPLLLLHGGFCTVDLLDPLVDRLAAHFDVVAPERRGHGRTPDIEDPITYGLMAADTVDR